MAAELGGPAPDLTLPDQDRQPVTLSERWKAGPIVLAFFPGAFSGTCTKEACTFRDDAQHLSALSASVIGVSVDTFFALKAWGEAEHLGFPLLSDFNKTAIREYGVYNEDMIGLKGLAKRSVFVIDRTGTIKYREVLDDARNEPNYARITETLKTLR